MNIIEKIFGRPGKFNAFNGVFVPTFLSIIGVILYLRMGLIVGSVGIVSTIIIVLLAVSVTASTGLALSSIVTTIRIGAGGAYSIVSKTLGLEVGGSVGIPLVLAQMFSVVFYILGFSEAWTFIFPDHPIKLVALGMLATIFALTIVGTSAAVKAQIFVFLLIVLSLVSIFMGGGAWWTSSFDIPVFEQPEVGLSFWAAFALFFPAVTGLMAGIGLSGDLGDPKRQIPKGVLWAIIITTVIYLAATIWFGFTSTPQELVNNNLIIVEKAFYGPIILAGILAATFSSGLTTFVAAPRLLQALGNANIIPASKFFAGTSKKGEPRNATLFSTTIILIAVLSGNLDSIAPLLTMFFLITYGILNIAVFIELALGLVSFRPTIRIPKIIPLYGFLASIVFMFLINPIAGFIALIFLFGIYVLLVIKQLETKEGDVRSGMFRGIAEWAAKKVVKLPESTKHIWKPNILMPVVITRTLLGNFPLVKAMAFPNGTMTVLGVKLDQEEEKAPDSDDLTDEEIREELEELPDLVKKFGEEGIFTSSSIIEVDDYVEGVITSLEAMESQVFHPNILFLPFKAERLSQTSLTKIYSAASRHGAGVVLVDRDEELGLGSEEDVHVWIDPKVMKQDFYEDRNFDLALLTAYKLQRNWDGKITIWMCVPEDRKGEAEYYLRKLIYEARLPNNTSIKVSTGGFKTTLRKAPQGDVHLIAVNEKHIKFINEIAKDIDKSFMFISDSGKEDVLA